MQLRGHMAQVIDDHDGHAEIVRHVLQQPRIGIQPTRGPAYADNRDICLTGRAGHKARKRSLAPDGLAEADIPGPFARNICRT